MIIKINALLLAHVSLRSIKKYFFVVQTRTYGPISLLPLLKCRSTSQKRGYVYSVFVSLLES
jgi:hypothetical protein